MRMTVADWSREHERLASILGCEAADCMDCSGCGLLKDEELIMLSEGYKDWKGYLLAKLREAGQAHDEEYRKEQIWNITTSIASGG